MTKDLKKGREVGNTKSKLRGLLPKLGRRGNTGFSMNRKLIFPKECDNPALLSTGYSLTLAQQLWDLIE